MHEMSIALEILNIVERAAQTNGAATVNTISIDVGTLAGVMIPSLEFGLEVAKQNTCARQAEIHIQEIPGRGQCPACKESFPMTFAIEPCPQCDNSFLKMIAGNELQVREIEVERAT